MIEQLARVLRNGGVVNHCATHRDERVLQRGAARRQLIRFSVPEPDHKKSVQRDDFALLKFRDFFLFGNQVGDQGVFPLRNGIDLQPLNRVLLFFDHLIHPLGIDVPPK
jgi:hypothetical protein